MTEYRDYTSGHRGKKVVHTGPEYRSKYLRQFSECYMHLLREPDRVAAELDYLYLDCH